MLDVVLDFYVLIIVSWLLVVGFRFLVGVLIVEFWLLVVGCCV